MRIKILIILFTFLFTSNCGYQPILSNSNSGDFAIEINKISGDREIGNLVKQKLKRYQENNSNKIYFVEITANYEKTILTKDTTGDTSNYRLITKVIFEVEGASVKETYTIKEKFDMKKNESIFEEKNYEKIIKRNMVNSIIQVFMNNLENL